MCFRTEISIEEGAEKKGLLCTLNTKWSFLTVHFLRLSPADTEHFDTVTILLRGKRFKEPFWGTEQIFERIKKKQILQNAMFRSYVIDTGVKQNIQFLHFCSNKRHHCFGRIKCIFEHHHALKANHMLINNQAWLSMKSYLSWLPQMTPEIWINVF